MRACETPEQRNARFEQSRLGMSASRAVETPEISRDCLEEDRHRSLYVNRSIILTTYCPTTTSKTLDTRHTGGGSYGNRIFHCILGAERKGFTSLGVDRTGGSIICLCWKTNSSPNGSALGLPNVAFDFISVSVLSLTRLFDATLLRVYLLAVG
ncbi:hypothetical protein AVEN_166768-1 [Araneus ventricosus]|uniref:Uncharacterized protein n=1 Tax=Araneus ventricosus TaxID=182803 RepID=A0A4Y2BR19_ARAVE|nr:hypothetical protein AVEN_166768-1 [Araneus ventricosus]